MNAEKRRVVVTGLGVVSPIGNGLTDFEHSLRLGKSGIGFLPSLEALNFRCQVAGVPPPVGGLASKLLSDLDRNSMNEAMIYAAIAAIEAWTDAGFHIPNVEDNKVRWNAGCVVGSGLSGIDTIATILVPKINERKVRRMGSSIVEQTMSSGISAKLSGLFALGNQVSSNSSACNTGTEAIHDCYWRIKTGLADIMIAGGAEAASPYVWGGFDAMRVLNSNLNDAPEKASRPMSATAGGFVPGAGSGILLLESLESAERRGARIYAELAAASVNCGGHRQGGSMTAPNKHGVQRCIRSAIEEANLNEGSIDLISGHLTATMADPLEVENWAEALEIRQGMFPFINAPKSLFGHCLGAAGAIESVAAVLQLSRGFIHPSLNCEDLHPQIAALGAAIPHTSVEKQLRSVAKASFGFGDVNGCLIFKRWG